MHRVVNINIVGEIDEELDAGLDLSKLRAHPPKGYYPLKNNMVWAVLHLVFKR